MQAGWSPKPLIRERKAQDYQHGTSGLLGRVQAAETQTHRRFRRPPLAR
jgi:hypothetical protein